MSGDAETAFELDTRLSTDTAFVADWQLSRVLLMDDARFPWLILVPRRAGTVELDEMTAADRAVLSGETSRAMAMLRAVTPCDKLNIGLLGNIVRQLHVHVVGRREGDAAWPGPVWGSGAAVRYEPRVRDALLTRLRAAS